MRKPEELSQVLASDPSIAADFETLAMYHTLRRKGRRASLSSHDPIACAVVDFYFLHSRFFLIMKVDVFMLSGTSRISQDFTIKTSLLISQKSSKTEA